MRHLFFSVLLSVFIIGCGGSGGSGSKKSPIPSTSSSSSLIPSSSGQSSFTQSSSLISSSSSNNSSNINGSFSSALSSSQSSLSNVIPFAFTSNSFVSGGKIPIQYSCFGGELSPQLQWDISSTEIKSFVLIMEDYDAIALVGYPYVHWNIYNIPADTRAIAEGATLRAMPSGSVEGVNDDGVPKYAGPCPPEGTGTHRYFFALYALNKESLPVNTSRPMRRNDFETQYASSIIQKAEITGTYLYK